MVSNEVDIQGAKATKTEVRWMNAKMAVNEEVIKEDTTSSPRAHMARKILHHPKAVGEKDAAITENPLSRERQLPMSRRLLARMTMSVKFVTNLTTHLRVTAAVTKNSVKAKTMMQGAPVTHWGIWRERGREQVRNQRLNLC